MPGRIDAVLFDFGGVFTPSPFDAVLRHAATLGADPERVLELTFGAYHEDSDHPWHRLERGETDLLAAREAIRALGAAEGVELDLFEALRAMAETPAQNRDPEAAPGSAPGAGFLREPVVERVRTLRREGYRTGLVTNNAAEFAPRWRPLLPLDELFHAVVDSSEVGMRKPDPRIYRHALERVGGVAPDRAVFLDDHPANVEGARRLGMQAVLVGDPFEPALAELDALLGR